MKNLDLDFEQNNHSLEVLEKNYTTVSHLTIRHLMYDEVLWSKIGTLSFQNLQVLHLEKCGSIFTTDSGMSMSTIATILSHMKTVREIVITRTMLKVEVEGDIQTMGSFIRQQKKLEIFEWKDNYYRQSMWQWPHFYSVMITSLLEALTSLQIIRRITIKQDQFDDFGDVKHAATHL